MGNLRKTLESGLARELSVPGQASCVAMSYHWNTHTSVSDCPVELIEVSQ